MTRIDDALCTERDRCDNEVRILDPFLRTHTYIHTEKSRESPEVYPMRWIIGLLRACRFVDSHNEMRIYRRNGIDHVI